MVCPSCQFVFSFSKVEYFFLNAKKINSVYTSHKSNFLNSKPTKQNYSLLNEKDLQTIQIVSETQVLDIFQHLNIQNISPNQLKSTDLLCDHVNKMLYYPMVDVYGATVGFKKLLMRKGEIVEETVPDSNSFGAVILPAKKPQKTKRAILVLNLLDFLSLVGESNNGENLNTLICLLLQKKEHSQEPTSHLNRYNNMPPIWNKIVTTGMFNLI